MNLKDKQKVPNVIEEASNIAASTIMLTASKMNALQYEYDYFELGLYDIKFTIIPQGKDTPTDAWLYNETPVADIDFVKTIPINLTPLNDSHYLFIDTLQLPSGKIISVTLYFSGTTSHIRIPDLTTYLIDPIFFNYEVSDLRTPKVRLNAIEQITTANIELTENNFHVINIAIDQPMSAGLDPYFYTEDVKQGLESQSYIQLVPTTSIQNLSNKESLELIIAGTRPVSLEAKLTVDSTLFSVNTDATRLAIDDAVASDLSIKTDEMPIYIKGTFSPITRPSFTVDNIQMLSTDEKFKSYMEKLLKEHEKENKKGDAVWFHIRDTFNAPQNDILNITEADAQKTEAFVTFNLPHGLDDQGNSMGWLCSRVLHFQNQRKQPESCSTSLVKTLQLALSSEDTGHFVLVETRRGKFPQGVNNAEDPAMQNNTDAITTDEKVTDIDINNLSPLALEPDIQHHFTNSRVFYTMLKTKLIDEGYRLGVLQANGVFEANQFQITDTVKVILLAPQPLLDKQANGWLEEVIAEIQNAETAANRLSSGQIAGIAIGGLAAIGLIAGSIYLVKKRRQNSQIDVKLDYLPPIGSNFISATSAATGGQTTRINTDNSTVEVNGNKVATVDNDTHGINILELPEQISDEDSKTIVSKLANDSISVMDRVQDIEDRSDGYTTLDHLRKELKDMGAMDEDGYLLPMELNPQRSLVPEPPPRLLRKPQEQELRLPTRRRNTKGLFFKHR